MNPKLTRTLLTLGVGVVIWFSPIPAGVSLQGWRMFALFASTVVGFILSPMPIGVLAFTAITLTVLLGVLKPDQALQGFGDTTIWLIVAAFLFSRGFIKTGLGRRIAYLIIRTIGDSTLKLGYAMALSDLVVAPATPSNTARGGGIIFPIVRGLASVFGSEPDKNPRRVGAYLMMNSFQVNCITSTMFLTSMAPNPLIAKLAAGAIPGLEMTWGTWALASCVPAAISLLVIPYLLYKVYPPEITDTPQAKAMACAELQKMGPMSRGEKIVLGVFFLSLLLWGTSSITKLNATYVALLGVCIMLWLGAIEWKDVIEDKGAFDALIWMGATLCMADFLAKFGFIAWFARGVASQLTGVGWLSALLILLVVYLYSHYGISGTTTHVTAMYAAFLTVAVAAGAPHYLAAFSLAFMSGLYCGLTHYGNGPATIYFGAGYMSQGTFWKLGFVVSVANLLIWLTIGPIWWKVIGLW